MANSNQKDSAEVSETTDVFDDSATLETPTTSGGQVIKPEASGTYPAKNPQPKLEGSESNADIDTTDELDSGPDQGQEPDAPQDDKKSDKPVKENEKQSSFPQLPSFVNIYFVIFLILLAGAGVIIFIAFRSSESNTPKTSSVESLNDKQLAALNGNTTLVGDSKHTLDIQSNSVFEGQVLMRSDLNIAGSIKVGGTLSLSSVTVGGTSNLGQLQVGGTLSVAGNTTIQGQVSIQKNLNVAGSGSFGGSLSASQLTVGSLQISGDFSPARHIAPSGRTPGKTDGGALGGGGTASVSGSDTSGTVTINTGSGPAAGCFISVNFVNGFNTTPHVVISPSNSNAGNISYYVNRSAASFSVCTATVPAGATTYLFDYIVFD
jgi:cytoskeletal protein CcmA (bactofilin family)